MTWRIVLFPAVFFLHAESLFSQMVSGEMKVDGNKRTFKLFTPSASQQKIPLVIVLHGGGGTGQHMMRLTGFDKLAEEENFIVVFPDGINNGWNDGRKAESLNNDADDVNFIMKLIDYIVENKNADPQKVFVTGISNGAIFSLYLAFKLPKKIAAIAPVCGSIPLDYAADYLLPSTISVLIINGTADSLVKYSGGEISTKRGKRGKVISTDSMVSILLKPFNCKQSFVKQDFPDVSIKDHSNAVSYNFDCCGSDTRIKMIKVIGGGHTWPGGVQYLPKFVVGTTCRDFNATAEIWRFFSNPIE